MQVFKLFFMILRRRLIPVFMFTGIFILILFTITSNGSQSESFEPSQLRLVIFDEDGSLFIRTDCEEEDILYDEIGSGLMVKEVQRSKRDLFHSLELYYRVLYLGQSPEEL